jgi:hypothetical protein
LLSALIEDFPQPECELDRLEYETGVVTGEGCSRQAKVGGQKEGRLVGRLLHSLRTDADNDPCRDCTERVQIRYELDWAKGRIINVPVLSNVCFVVLAN